MPLWLGGNFFSRSLVDTAGLKMDPTKTEVVQNYPVPKTKRNVHRFLGFSGCYRKFTKNFSEVSPISAILKDQMTFEWSDKHQKAFASIKNAIGQNAVLHFPDFQSAKGCTPLFIVKTDASRSGNNRHTEPGG